MKQYVKKKWISSFPNEVELVSNWNDVFSCFSSLNLSTVYLFGFFPEYARIWIVFLQMRLAPPCQCRNISNSEIFNVLNIRVRSESNYNFLFSRLVQQPISSVIFPYHSFTFIVIISPCSFDKRWEIFTTCVFVSLEVLQT